MNRRYPETLTYRLARIRNRQLQELRPTRVSFNWREDPKIKELKEFAASFKLDTEDDNATTMRNFKDFCKVRNKIDKESTVYGTLEEYSNDFQALLHDSSFSDISIKCGTGTLKLHKNILASRSPVFAAMFRNYMRESAESEILIVDLQLKVVQELVTFIYTNKVKDLTVPRACDLLNAAEKYQILTLKHICTTFLESNLNLGNAFLILQKAVLYDKWLEKRAIYYISDKFEYLSVMQEWRELKLNNPSLALEICSIVIDKLSKRNVTFDTRDESMF